MRHQRRGNRAVTRYPRVPDVVPNGAVHHGGEVQGTWPARCQLEKPMIGDDRSAAGEIANVADGQLMRGTVRQGIREQSRIEL